MNSNSRKAKFKDMTLDEALRRIRKKYRGATVTQIGHHRTRIVQIDDGQVSSKVMTDREILDMAQWITPEGSYHKRKGSGAYSTVKRLEGRGRTFIKKMVNKFLDDDEGDYDAKIPKRHTNVRSYD